MALSEKLFSEYEIQAMPNQEGIHCFTGISGLAIYSVTGSP